MLRSTSLLVAASLALTACVLDSSYDMTTGSTGGTTTTGETTSTSDTTTTSTGTGGATAGTGGATSGTGGSGGAGGAGGAGGMGGAGGAGGMSPCGDGALDTGETCDDGNAVAADGCSATCTIEGNPGLCPTQALFTLGAGGVWISDTTTGKPDFTGTFTCGGTTSEDAVYQFTPATTGTVTVDLVGSFSMVLAARTACGGGTETCTFGTGTISRTLAVTTGVPFFVYVGGGTGADGPFTLHVHY